MQTREEKIFQRIGHCVMIVLSACAIIPMILLVMSSVTDNNTLISPFSDNYDSACICTVAAGTSGKTVSFLLCIFYDAV